MEHSILVDLFMEEAGRYAPMSADVEQKYLKLYKETKDIKYKTKLINHNLRFVMSVASEYKKDGVSPLEFINQGVLGLDCAIEKYDISTGLKLITFAVHWIRASISEYIRDNANLIRLPANQHLALQKALRKSTKQNSKLSDNDYELFNITQRGTSLSEPVSDDDNSTTLGDILPDDKDIPSDSLDNRNMKHAIASALRSLPPAQKNIMTSLFGIDGKRMTLHEVGNQLDISYERVRQLKLKACDALRASHPELKQYIGE